ncbi:hypothetical protein [Natronococcus wangiae]|uniref:hypothetical protein n=1 Tax=Natronococcus wangiae TaxID=3068275 RepID=UPI00273D7C9C|nr:hypothetical protein [Natronococcus sp. AD5]
MFGDRTPSEDARAKPATDRLGRLLSLTLVGLAAVLTLLVLGTRRGNESTLDPPF